MRGDPPDILPYEEDDDLIAQARASREAATRLYRPARPMVVLGRGSRLRGEIDLAACRADGVPLRRRGGGGCAVVLDPGSLVVSLAFPLGGFGNNRRLLDDLTAWLIGGLARLGIHGIRREGPCDLALGSRKVSGACLQRSRDLAYFSATLLVAPEVALMERYLRYPPREPAYRRGRSHCAFVGRLPLRGGRFAGDPVETLAVALRPELGLPPFIGAIDRACQAG